jgi:hypothetical protein
LTPRLQGWIIAGATIWSMSVLTATYAGYLKSDTAFVASVLGGAISAAGLSVGNKQDPKQDPPNKDKDAGGY